MDGVVETLETFHGRVQNGHCDSVPAEITSMIVHAEDGFESHFSSFVLAREDYREAKPHPDAYLKAMRLHGLQPDDCVVVEDSEQRMCRGSSGWLARTRRAK